MLNTIVLLFSVCFVGMPTATAVIDNSQAAFMQQRRQTAGNRQQSARGLVHHHRRMANAEMHNRPEEQQQQQLPLPDLITSSMSGTPPPPPPPPPQPQPSTDKKPNKKILLEVELCPECYYDHQKFKVVAANRRDKSNDGPLSRRHRSTGIPDRRSFDYDVSTYTYYYYLNVSTLIIMTPIYAFIPLDIPFFNFNYCCFSKSRGFVFKNNYLFFMLSLLIRRQSVLKIDSLILNIICFIYFTEVKNFKLMIHLSMAFNTI